MEDKTVRLTQRSDTVKPQNDGPWWEQRLGAFAGSEEYDEAMRLGREYRESLRPKDDDRADAD